MKLLGTYRRPTDGCTLTVRATGIEFYALTLTGSDGCNAPAFSVTKAELVGILERGHWVKHEDGE